MQVHSCTARCFRKLPITSSQSSEAPTRVCKVNSRPKYAPHHHLHLSSNIKNAHSPRHSPLDTASSSSPSPTLPPNINTTSLLLLATAFLAFSSPPEAAAAAAFQIHTEPSNALSLPTWAVHTSSVIEWATAISLMWRYGEVSGNSSFKGLAWGMLPALGSAMCACTWHLFYNSQEMGWLVVLQAALTVIGNGTCWWAAYRIYKSSCDGEGEEEEGVV